MSPGPKLMRTTLQGCLTPQAVDPQLSIGMNKSARCMQHPRTRFQRIQLLRARGTTPREFALVDTDKTLADIFAPSHPEKASSFFRSWDRVWLLLLFPGTYRIRQICCIYGQCGGFLNGMMAPNTTYACRYIELDIVQFQDDFGTSLARTAICFD